MMGERRGLVRAGVAAILVVALLLRLRGLAFGLPALYDPDEPIFFLNALKLLKDRTLNPGWFGHPGTTTIYALAVIDLLVLGTGLLTGRFASPEDLGRAIYADPGVVVLPGRVFILLCGLATIALTFVLARRLFGTRAGLIAAGLLAIDPIHVRYSQIIRTDMHETVFLLACLIASVDIARRGRRRDYLWAAVWLGFAIATKWPAVTGFVAIAGAAGYRLSHVPRRWRTEGAHLAMAAGTMVIALVAASPYLLLDLSTVLANIGGEAQTHHVGATGNGLFANMAWYVAHPFRDALGLPGLIAALAGFLIAPRRDRVFAAVLVPFLLISFVAISAQGLVWERWAVPLIPFATIAAAVAIEALWAGLADRLPRRGGMAAGAGVLAVVTLPLLVSVEAYARERTHDTRAAASAWARAHIARGETVIIEQLAFDLLGTGWRFLFPVGDAGCVDVAAALKARIPYATVERWRGGRKVINVGTINPATFATCRADWAIVVDYDRYLREPTTYAAELRTYRALVARGKIAATFRPDAGQMGGPTIRIIRLNSRSPGWKRPI